MSHLPAPRWLGGGLAPAALLAAAAVATPAISQTLGQAPATDFAWVRWLGALALCLALAVGGALALRARLGGARAPMSPALLGLWLKGSNPPPRRLRVIEAVRASPTLEVCLLACDGREYLVAATPHGAIQLSPGPQTDGRTS